MTDFHSLDTLLTLMTMHGPAGDEAGIADWIGRELEAQQPAPALTRLQDNLIAVRGAAPKVAIFAHLDTTGFTLGYDRHLIPIGSPHASDGDILRSSSAETRTGQVRIKGRGTTLRKVEKADAVPGSRWVYAHKPAIKDGAVTGPYLDNRGGVWCVLRALQQLENVAVAFTTGEEQHGHGARVCAEWLYRTHNITQALIADLTWHTGDTPCGKGVVISVRDQFCPRQSFLAHVLNLAANSGIPHQREVQSAGSSDGGHILRSSAPIDWVFIGAPEKRPHTARERAHISDLNAMADMLVYLAENLT